MRQSIIPADLSLPTCVVVEPAVVDAEPAILESVEDIRVSVPETNVGMIVGFAGMDGLRRNNVIPRHHHDQRNARMQRGLRHSARTAGCSRRAHGRASSSRPAPGARSAPAAARKIFDSELAFRAHDVLEQPQFGGGIADDVVTLVGKTHHQGRLAVMRWKSPGCRRTAAGHWAARTGQRSARSSATSRRCR